MTEAVDLVKLRGLLKSTTPGPWRWELNFKNKHLTLCGGNPHEGFGKFDKIVMDFVRWGMSGATARFITIAGLLEGAFKFGKPVPGREHHAHWFQNVDHPDAALIALTPNLARKVIEQTDEITAANLGAHEALLRATAAEQALTQARKTLDEIREIAALADARDHASCLRAINLILRSAALAQPHTAGEKNHG